MDEEEFEKAVSLLVSVLDDPDFQKAEEAFMSTNVDRFSFDEEENRIEHMQIHREYVDLMEEQLLKKIGDGGFDVEKFLDELRSRARIASDEAQAARRASAEGGSIEDESTAWAFLLSVTDFACFKELMLRQRMLRRTGRRRAMSPRRLPRLSQVRNGTASFGDEPEPEG
eukprot:Hpha_TRINITY_DN14891_c0_g1::TRINITY_DN14891_c0_g1_i1::g.170334::m.170334/K16742/ARL2BP, BART; ADP-ribosylation factor-like protein 2-binding protein